MSETLDTPAATAAVITEPVPDLQLQLLMRLLDREQRSSLPITLTTSSGILHGDLIGHEAWKADWARALRQVEGEGTNLLAEFPETVDQGLREMVADDDASSLPRWIHLRDATLVMGGAGKVRLSLWRGRLADVSGWALGRPQ
ncbi:MULTISPECIES: hypothetical protein [Streptomyces]|uniref:Uncharacterized protein n=2 Tax=Streptomyces TaxID=1883 RepID=A0ABU2RTI0_9ACTN|nr:MULTISPECIES: hypothetical protein [unclassified Streptomyces]MBK3591041.1 hypothetical protein [Streptomyces sp. MBT51]MDT0431867.1 hypothetical protein [Streptomyces sp. DSM 41770]MYU36808.1 hypothetical protein [Streptomyces sp. SID8358]SCE03782.1 hypothetical protein GA0115239_11704 [Streptomyces sp. BpilaLS-43]